MNDYQQQDPEHDVIEDFGDIDSGDFTMNACHKSKMLHAIVLMFKYTIAFYALVIRGR